MSHPRTDPGRLERGPVAPGRLSLSGPSLLPRHCSERRCFKCQTGHSCKACRLCLDTRLACLPVCLAVCGGPYSVDPEAAPRLIVEGQFTCSREEANKEKVAPLVTTLWVSVFVCWRCQILVLCHCLDFLLFFAHLFVWIFSIKGCQGG